LKEDFSWRRREELKSGCITIRREERMEECAIVARERRKRRYKG